MEKRLKTYLAAIDGLLEKLDADAARQNGDFLENAIADKETLLSEHLTQIGFFQHERLIHLIVTCLFAVLAVSVFLVQLITLNIGLMVLFLLLLVLLIPYIRHYYILENGVQRMYKQYDRMRELLGVYSALHS